MWWSKSELLPGSVVTAPPAGRAVLATEPQPRVSFFKRVLTV